MAVMALPLVSSVDCRRATGELERVGARGATRHDGAEKKRRCAQRNPSRFDYRFHNGIAFPAIAEKQTLSGWVKIPDTKSGKVFVIARTGRHP
jgi:hypothetical protein